MAECTTRARSGWRVHKRRYRRRHDARRAARQAQHRLGKTAIYRCSECGFWHVGRQATQEVE